MKTKLMIRKLCRDILCLAMQISEDSQADIYVKYYPHVNELDIEIFPEGFNKNHKLHTDYQVDLIKEDVVKELNEILKNIKTMKRGICNE